MSRIGKQPITVPKEAKVELKGNYIKINGPLGELEYNIPYEIETLREEDQLIVKIKRKTKRSPAMWGLVRAVINNMVVGVTKGFSKKLLIKGTGYKAEKGSDSITLSLGYSHQIIFPIPKGVDIQVAKDNSITVSGYDKALVGNVTAKIRNLRPPNAYAKAGKGVMYADETLRIKERKSAGA